MIDMIKCNENILYYFINDKKVYFYNKRIVV